MAHVADAANHPERSARAEIVTRPRSHQDEQIHLRLGQSVIVVELRLQCSRRN
jgi:hypothetical protein